MAATFGTSAASNWNSPSSLRSGAISLASSVAFCILATVFVNLASLPDPFVENESIATLGSMPAIVLAVFAEVTAISASCSAVGQILRAQSANTNTPSLQY